MLFFEKDGERLSITLEVIWYKTILIVIDIDNPLQGSKVLLIVTRAVRKASIAVIETSCVLPPLPC